MTEPMKVALSVKRHDLERSAADQAGEEDVWVLAWCDGETVFVELDRVRWSCDLIALLGGIRNTGFRGRA
jgi:hypothetical protein